MIPWLVRLAACALVGACAIASSTHPQLGSLEAKMSRAIFDAEDLVERPGFCRSVFASLLGGDQEVGPFLRSLRYEPVVLNGPDDCFRGAIENSKVTWAATLFGPKKKRMIGLNLRCWALTGRRGALVVVVHEMLHAASRDLGHEEVYAAAEVCVTKGLAGE